MRIAYHIPSQNDLRLPVLLKVLLQLRPGERPRELLPHDSLPIDRLQLVKLLRKVRPGREEGGASRRLVQNVDDGRLGGAVPRQQGGNDLARRIGVGHAELALGVLVLGVDDEEERR